MNTKTTQRKVKRKINSVGRKAITFSLSDDIVERIQVITPVEYMATNKPAKRNILIIVFIYQNCVWNKGKVLK